MLEKRGSLKRISLISFLVILVSLFLVFGIIDNETNVTQDSNFTDYNITNLTAEQNNTSQDITTETNSTEITNNTNQSQETPQLPQVNINSDNIPTFIIINKVANSKIINERLEIYNLGNGYNNAILYSRDRFKNYNNKFYTLNGLADISVNKGIINITYGINNYLALKPYFIYNNNKISYSDLDNNAKSNLNIKYYIRKNRDYFEFGNNFTNINGITAFGFDYETNSNVKYSENRIFIDDILILDYNDLAKNNYDLELTDNSVKISNLKQGFNDLDPYIYLNSSSSLDGYILGDGSTGYNAVTNSLNGPSGYDSNGNIYHLFYSFPTYYLGPNVNITKASLRLVENQAIDATDGGAGPCNFYITWEHYLYDGTFIGNSLDTSDYVKGSYFTSLTFGAPNYYQIPINISKINQTGNTDFRISPTWQQEQGCNEYDNMSMSESPTGQPLLNITYAYILNYSFSYDTNGNLIYGFGLYYEYDDFNRLIKVRQLNANGSLIAQYWYGPDGNRIKKLEVTSNGNQTTYYIGNFVQIRNSSGVFNTTYYYDRDALVAERRYDNQLYFYHPDHLGSTSLITNITGDAIELTNYDPYGLVTEGGSSRYLYTGKEKDKETNLEYYGARYYSPYVSRFTQPDINIPDIYNPQDLNRYSYVRNNPYKYVDPSGKEPVLSQIGSYNIIYNQLQQFESKNSGLTATQTLNSLVSFSGAASSQPQAETFLYNSEARYTYTKEFGFVDTLHLFTSAEKTKQSGAFLAALEGYLNEFAQLGGDPSSAFSYEDLLSNKLGREFAAQLNDKESLSEQYKKFIESKGGSLNPLMDLAKDYPSAAKNIPSTTPSNTPSYSSWWSGGKALPISSNQNKKDKNKK